MKYTAISFSTALAFLASGATAFVPSTTRSTSTKSSLSAVPPSMEWKGYYTNYDDNKVVKTGADVGFDPLEFSKTNAGLFFMREAEIKHCRLAMLAAGSWPIAELLDKPLANLIGQEPVVDAMDRNPSVLNGGLDRISPFYWAAILIAASAVDLYQINKANYDESYTPGDLGFDPLGLYPKDDAGQKTMMAKELRNGRLAMIAVFGFAVQEYVTKIGVVEQTPMFFKPFGGLF